MKMSVDIPDSLFEEAHRLAQREETTLSALVEEGLRRAVAERPARDSFRLRDASFGGSGLHPDAEGATWDEIRDLIYEGRGG